MRLGPIFLIPAAAMTIGCTGNGDGADGAATSGQPQAQAASVQGQAQPAQARPFRVEPVGQFDEPWAMTFLPNGNLLVTERPGRLRIRFADSRQILEVAGVPEVDYGGQGGLGDVVLHPGFERNGLVYLSFVEAGPDGTRGAAVGRGRLLFSSAAMPGAPVGVRLDGFEVIWRQQPKMSGRGHYGHRLAFSSDGRYLFISSGERQEFTPAQDMSGNLGKILRLNADGSVPADNPFASRGGVTAQIWTLGHRNPLGLAFDSQGRLWEHEMGPRGGDEVNLIERGRNYGYPIVSNGDHYDGRDIPDHPTRPEFAAPRVWWNPSVSPAGMIV